MFGMSGLGMVTTGFPIGFKGFSGIGVGMKSTPSASLTGPSMDTFTSSKTIPTTNHYTPDFHNWKK